MTDSIDDDVARLTASGWAAPPPAITPSDLAIVRKLMGEDNARRLANRRRGANRPFRPTPEPIEYWFFVTRDGPFVEGVVERIVNGRRVGRRRYHNPYEMDVLITALIKAGQTVREIKLGEPEPPRGAAAIKALPPAGHRFAPPVQPPSQRRAMLDQLSRYRP